MSLLKTGPGQLFCKGPFVIEENDLFFGMYSPGPSAPRYLVFADSPRKFCVIFPPRKNYSRIQEYFLKYILSESLKQKLNLMRKRKCCYKNNKKRLAKFRLSPWCSELLALKRTFLLEKKFSELGKHRCFHITENLTTRTVPQSVWITKLSFSG